MNILKKLFSTKKLTSKRPYKWIVVTSTISVILMCLSACSRMESQMPNPQAISPEDALRQFYANDGPEDTLMDPLIIAGEKVVPLVLKEIQNKNMLRRRYAIGFLGNGSYKQALPVLEDILQDSSEKDYIRGDALHAIYMIDESLGNQYARRFINQTDYLGQISKRILSGDISLKERRSYSDAVAGKHK